MANIIFTIYTQSIDLCILVGCDWMEKVKTVINCGDSLTINHVTALHTQIISALDNNAVIELVADSITSVDSAGLQMISALKNELNRIGGKLIWNGPSKILLESSGILGMDSYIGLG